MPGKTPSEIADVAHAAVATKSAATGRESGVILHSLTVLEPGKSWLSMNHTVRTIIITLIIQKTFCPAK
eukprot:3504464-Amphidinium_carterae.1